jgi:hypothetical protein
MVDSRSRATAWVPPDDRLDLPVEAVKPRTVALLIDKLGTRAAVRP